jgi:hypothetical protein
LTVEDADRGRPLRVLRNAPPHPPSDNHVAGP